MLEIARETILAIAYFLQAGKENSQKQVLAYFERTAIGKPDSVFYFSSKKENRVSRLFHTSVFQNLWILGKLFTCL